ncbi:MAG: PIN domain-containing protein [Phycisphaerales bacterium]
MRIYFDVSCLNRPFDDQAQPRIRLEAQAVSLIFTRIQTSEWAQIASEVSIMEIEAIPDQTRRTRVSRLLPSEAHITPLSATIIDRAGELAELGFSIADAAHLASAEAAEAAIFLTCDDRLLRRAARFADRISVVVANPLTWLEQHNASDTQ